MKCFFEGVYLYNFKQMHPHNLHIEMQMPEGKELDLALGTFDIFIL